MSRDGHFDSSGFHDPFLTEANQPRAPLARTLQRLRSAGFAVEALPLVPEVTPRVKLVVATRAEGRGAGTVPATGDQGGRGR